MSHLPGMPVSDPPPAHPSAEPVAAPDRRHARPAPGFVDRLAGETADFRADLRPYLPSEMVGGAVPHIFGSEDESVWNAASQACGTERVHYVWSAEGGRIWYLACPSSALASNPDSWCPLAAALPGNSEYWDRQTVYIYEQEGMASALRWEAETGRMQLFLGAARTLLPRIQSMDANFVSVNPDIADIVPWRNRQLRTEKLGRATARLLLYSGLLLNALAIFFLFSQFVATNMVRRDLDKVQMETDQASADLMIQATNALQSDTIKHMVRVQELLDALVKIDGTLVKYKVDKTAVTWEALVPPSFSNCTGALAGCQVKPGLEKDGRVRISGSR